MIVKKTMRLNKKGFTLAEIMMAVAIIVILAGVSFIGVANYFRSMAQLERDGIAKEIYVAAQNHLTMAEGQGFLGLTEGDFGTLLPISTDGGSEGETVNTYYYVVNNGSGLSDDNALSMMLPQGAIDETVRTGGSYIIHYQKEPALVLKVYYCVSGGGHRYTHQFTSDEYNNYATFTAQTATKELRQKYGTDNSVLGYYGSENAVNLEKKTLETPTIKVTNAEKLTVEITDPNGTNTDSNSIESLRLVITGVTSGKQVYITLKTNGTLASDIQLATAGGGKTVDSSTQPTKYTIILDDITTDGLHFAEQFPTLIPGEDITIQAIADSTTALTNIAMSAVHTTNSLFAEVSSSTEGDNTYVDTAYIENIRHMENLDNNISKVSNYNGSYSTDIRIAKAEQISDISWTEFKTAIGSESAQIYKAGSSSSASAAGTIFPISPNYAISYEGDGYQISDISVNVAGSAGLFGEVVSGSAIKNLELLDFSILSEPLGDASGNAGALIGSAVGTTITNVVAYNSSPDTQTEDIVCEKGSAGGLIGSMSGGSVTACAASLYVRTGDGDAGGLIGTISGDSVTVTGSYSGGHTLDKGVYSQNTDAGASDISSKGLVNVIGTGNVGGLIGDSGSTTINQSYSTCSAYSSGTSSTYVGGLVGTAAGSVSNSYATGWVSAKNLANPTAASTDLTVKVYGNVGAFAGNLSDSASVSVSDCNYFMIINEIYSDDEGFSYLSPVAGSESFAGITAFDDTASTYQAFAEWDNESADAIPYDSTVAEYYDYKYSLKSVKQLGLAGRGDDTPEGDTYFVTTHYGDWPMPDVQVINIKAGS